MTQSNNPPDSQGDVNNAQQDAAPVTFRSRVRSLLGVPDSGSGAVLGQSSPPVGFQYANVSSTDTFITGDVLANPFLTETVLPSLESESLLESIDSPRETPAGDSRSIETSPRPQSESFTAHELAGSNETEIPSLDNENTTPDIPRHVYRHIESEEPSHIDEQFGELDQRQRIVESVQDEISIEQLYQEHANVQQFDMDVPGVSEERPLSFPSLSNLSEDSPQPEDQSSRQGPISDSQEPDIQPDESPSSARLTERVSQELDASEYRDDSPLSSYQSDARRFEGDDSRSRRTARNPREDRISADSQPIQETPAPNNRQAGLVEGKTHEAVEQVSQSPSRMSFQVQHSTDTSGSVPINIRRDTQQQPEPLNEQGATSNENSRFSDLQYLNADSVNHSYREAMEQIEQLRASMQQLASRDSLKSQNNGHERQSDEPPRQPLPPPPPVVIVQRPAGRTRAPRAFWERRYLGHFRLRTLR